MIEYEYPFNERVRNLLRLEDQFDRLFYFTQQDDPRAHHAALITLFEITEAVNRFTGRSDARTDLLQELERQRQALTALREHPEVERALLDKTLRRLEDVINGLANQVKPADSIRQNEWLQSLRSRIVIPGGVCEFDMPSYYAWQHRPAEERKADLQRWCQPMLPLYESLVLALQLLRRNCHTQRLVARQGVYQASPDGKPYQLLRVYLPASSRIFPEISANKYSISIRFAQQDGSGKPQPVMHDVEFEMSLCTSI